MAEMNVIRVLNIIGGSMGYGGVSEFLMNYYRHMDKNIIQYDFVCQGYEEGIYDNEILSLGGKIYYIPHKLKHPIRFTTELQNIIKLGNYKIVHSHIDASNAWTLKIARDMHVQYRISHSHSMGMQTKNPLKRIINMYLMTQIPHVATDLWACSKEAGKWLYGKKNINKIVIINNAIDINRFLFNSDNREKIRQKYGLKDAFVIGCVGRLSQEKNHLFLLSVFREILNRESCARLLIIGDGELRQKLEEKAEQLKISDKVIFAGNQNNTNEYYSAMDVFVFPSLFEGLGIALVEAQCNGVHCICSDNLPEESDVLGIEKISLNDSVFIWAQKVLNYKNNKEREDGVYTMRESCFNINIEANKLQRYYLRCCK